MHARTHWQSSKGHRRLKAVGYAVALCAGIFIAGFIIGALVGGEHRKEVIRAGILERLLIRDRGEEGIFVVHTCGAAANFEYSLDLKLPREIGSVESGDVDLLESLAVHKEFITELLGGASAGITFKELLAATQEALAKEAGRPRMITAVSAFVSGITGYAFGYWVGSTHATACNSKPVRESLSKAEYWPDIIRRHLFGVLYALSLDRPDQLNEKRPALLEIFEGPLANPAFACGFEWFRRPRVVKTVEYDGATFSSEEVREVSRTVATFQRMRPWPEYDGLVKLQRDARRSLFTPGFSDALSDDVFAYNCLLDSTDSLACDRPAAQGDANKSTPRPTDPLRRMKQACQALDSAYRAQSAAAPPTAR